MRPHLYILCEGKAVPMTDVLAWAKWFESADDERVLCVTKLLHQGEVHTKISTVFLGIDHEVEGSPILWETAVFFRSAEHDRDVRVKGRYASHLDAIAGHHRVVAEVIEQIAKAVGGSIQVEEVKP